MGTKDILSFIDNIPNDKLKGLPTLITTLYKDNTFRCDMQGMTSGKPRKHNIQIQVNTSFRRMAPSTVAGPVLVPEDGSGGFTAAKIKQELKDKIVSQRPVR